MEEFRALEKNIKNTTGIDRVDLLIKLVELAYENDKLKMGKYAQEAFDLAEEINYENGRLEAIYSLLYSELILGTNEKALDYFNLGLPDINKSVNDFLAARFFGKGQAIFNRTGDYKSAIEYSIRAIDLFEKVGNKFELAKAKYNLAIIYERMGEFDKALEGYRKTQQDYEEIDSKGRGLSLAYSAEAEMLSKRKDYAEALELCNKALQISKQQSNNNDIAYTLVMIAGIYINLEDYEKAEEIILEGLEIIENHLEEIDKMYLCFFYESAGLVYLKMGGLDSSEKYLLKAISFAQSGDIKNRLIGNYKNLFKLYKVRENFKKALEYHELYVTLLEESQQEEKTKQINELIVKFETDQSKKEAEIQRLRNVELAEANEKAEVAIIALEKSEDQMQKRAEELEMFNAVMVDREMRIVEMKTEINEMCEQLGKNLKYPPIWDEES